MKDNLIDLSKYREDKIKENEESEKHKKDMETFINVISKTTMEMNDEEMKIYKEIGMMCALEIKNTYSMAIVVFREQLYVINHIGGKFEFIGKLEDIIGKGIFGE